MSDKQFKDIKVGDIMVYSKVGVLIDCEFIALDIRSSGIGGNVTKAGWGPELYYFGVGERLHFSKLEFELGIVKFKNSETSSETQISLSREEFAALAFYVGKMSHPPSCFMSLYSKLCEATPKDLQEYYVWESFKNPVETRKSEEEIRNLQEYLWPAPKAKAAALRMPDGKFAPKNYRRVMYPAGGTGELILRHILMGDFVEGKGTATNVHVEEWCADSKAWKPKTYALAKIKPAATE